MIAYLTTALMVLHSIAGCCWHHAHHAAGLSDRAAVSPSEDTCSHHLHAEGADDESPKEDGSGHEECEGDRCVFVLSSTSFASLQQLCEFVAAVPAVFQSALCERAIAHAFLLRDLGPPDRPLPGGPLVLRI